ncbi:ATP-binding cassette domain-containing protein [Cellulomonas cellasea]|uniref:ABC transporter ATP-binding protein n=1 Tax=Cellulomonas cellasea TaxID=43670 RepID=UPI0025A3BB47|nr:ATP-binding cassette domain-containing protein [Cellulomonas cellasea]MDM8084026.1 ATP-binding cassette domain-containing protein [Cellulomonas cellasea]
MASNSRPVSATTPTPRAPSDRRPAGLTGRPRTIPHTAPRRRAASLQAHGLTKRYGRVTAVDGLSFHVRPGIVTGFLGPNGAGKSTTLRMILGLDRPTEGAATINGRRLAELRHPMQVVGSLLDARAVHPSRSAADHLLSIARTGDVPRGRVAELLEQVGLADAATRPAGDFSLGMKQRLGIATALVGDPDIVILDESLNGLDAEGIRWARTLMRELAAEGRTMLFSSHLMGEMELTADHLLVIDNGRLLADQPLPAFLSAHTTTQAHVRTPDRDALRAALSSAGLAASDSGPDGLDIPGATTDHVGHIAATAGVELAELSPRKGSLEDAFLRMTAAQPRDEE